MIKVFKIDEEIAGLTPIKNRGEHTTEDDVVAAFAALGKGDFVDAGVFLGSFDGNAGWERHMKGDELVQVVAGSTEFDIMLMTTSGRTSCPQGCFLSSQEGAGIDSDPRKELRY